MVGRSQRPWAKIATATVVGLAQLGVGGAARIASAANVFSFLAQDRQLLDASADGRYVLQTDRAGTFERVDVYTGITLTLPSGVGPSHIGADGRYLYFDSTDGLVAGDVDGLTDVYRYDATTGAAELVSTGFPGWGFDIRDVGDVAGIDHAVFRGLNGGLAQQGTFVVDGLAATVQVGSSFVGETNVVPESISADGRYVAYLLPAQDKLIVEDRVQHTTTQANLGSVAAGVTVWAARLSGDGRHVAIVGGPGGAKVLYVRHLATATSTDVGAFQEGLLPSNSLDINTDGTVVLGSRNVAGSFAGSAIDMAQIFIWNRGTTTVISTPAGQPASGPAMSGRLLPGGTTAYFTSLSDGLVPGHGVASAEYDVYVNRAGATPSPSPAVTFGAPSAFTPRTPVRIVDTRPDKLIGYTGSRPVANTTINVPLRDLNGVPSNATAVALQITATGGTGTGFVGVSPAGTPVGQTSTLNLDLSGETVANLAVSAIGADGSVNVFNSSATHVIVDLLGWWTPAPGAVTSGRYVPLAARVLDTRPTSLVGYSGPKPADATTTVVQISGSSGIPVGVTAVAVNITLDQTSSASFVQAGPASSLVPGSSSTLNVSSPGQVVAASTIVPVDGDGRIAIFNERSAHLIVDVTGWFTDATAASSTAGRFAPATSVVRALDTRPAPHIGWVGPKPVHGTIVQVPAGGIALVGNLTITETAGAGFVQVGGAATLVPGSNSSINASIAGETLANAFIAPVAGGIAVYEDGPGTHLVVDVTGFMTS